MKAQEVDKALQQKFLAEDARLVFWHDAEGEFADYVASGLPDDLAGVQVLDVAQVGGLSAKLKLEIEDHTGKYLVYSQGARPTADEGLAAGHPALQRPVSRRRRQPLASRTGDQQPLLARPPQDPGRLSGQSGAPQEAEAARRARRRLSLHRPEDDGRASTHGRPPGSAGEAVEV